MKVWTVQRVERYEELLSSGTLRSSWVDFHRWADEDDRKVFRAPYSWLTAQYDRRVSRLRRPPIWLSVRRPDMRGQWGGPRRRPDLVRLTFEVPAERVLLYAGDVWGGVILNDGAIALRADFDDPAQDEQWQREVDRLQADRRLKRASWEAIFDLRGCREGGYSNGSVEGIIDELRREWLIAHEHFPRVA